MAPADRTASDHLNYLKSVADEARRFGFFALVRAAEARAAVLPRIGRSRRPNQNVVDLAQSPSLDFPANTIDALEQTATGRIRVRSTFLGLTGPMGALPIHLSEFALLERRYAKAHPFGRFLDLLSDRMLQFFYRAWGDSQPAVQADRPEDDRFALYLGHLSGLPREDGPNPVQRQHWLSYLSLLIVHPSPGVIVDSVARLLGQKVRVVEFLPRWRPIDFRDRTSIGSGGLNRCLSKGAVLGSRVRVVDDTYRVVISCANMQEYRDLLPGQRKFALVCDALKLLSPSHLDWEVELEIEQARISPATLDGKAPLGWSSWVAPRRDSIKRADLRLNQRHLHPTSSNTTGD
jgi:type VI secretion system protein ImpH